MFVSGGVIGLCLWLAINGWALGILYKDFLENKKAITLAAAVSIVAFHLYGIFQSMQYISMIWFLIFLCLGFAMTTHESALSPGKRRLGRILSHVFLIAVISGCVLYAYNPELEKTAEKYDLAIYGKNRENGRYINFHDLEKWPEGYVRWSRREAVVELRAESNILCLDAIAFPHNSDGPEGLKLRLSLNEDIKDEVHYFNGGRKHLYYYSPLLEGKKVTLRILVDRTFNPYRMGLGDDFRYLGVAVSPISFLTIFPRNGIGFYPWETWGGGGIPGWPSDRESRFRWTGMRASMNLVGAFVDEPFGEIALFLLCSHPDIGNKPVTVKISGDDGVVREETFKEHRWRRIVLKGEHFERFKVATLQVSRTWNPKLAGVSGDARDLGVAVAVLGGGEQGPRKK